MFKVSISAVIASLAFAFIVACSTNTQDEKKENVSTLRDNAALPHPELANILSNNDFLKSECVEVTWNGEKITACHSNMNLSTSWDSLSRYKDSIETDYIHSLCFTHPDRVLTYITIPKPVFLNQPWSQVEEEVAVLTTSPKTADYKFDESDNGTTLIQLPLFSRNCEPFVKLDAGKVGDTLKIKSNDGIGIDYNSDCQCNFNINYTYNHADENIHFVDIDGKIFPTRYE